jgi:hypothetical protein
VCAFYTTVCCDSHDSHTHPTSLCLSAC